MDLAASLGPHGGYIAAAYAFTALVLGGLILNAWRDNRAQKRALAEHGDATRTERR